MKSYVVLILLLTSSLFAFSQTKNNPLKPESTEDLFTQLLIARESLMNSPGIQHIIDEFGVEFLEPGGRSPWSVQDTPLPDFSLTNLQGQVVTKQSLEGKVVFLHIWHPDYQDFPDEISYLNELKWAYEDQNILFLSLTNVPALHLQRYLLKKSFHFEHLPDAFSLIIEITPIPMNVLVDKNGIIRYLTADPNKNQLQPQAIDWQIIREQIDALLIE